MLSELVADSLFNEIAILLVLAAVVGFVGTLLRQPLIVSFILVGIIAGPVVLDVVETTEIIELLSELGIAVLLFLVGIKLDYKLVRSLGVVSLVTGLGQVMFTAGFGFLICQALGLSTLSSAYVAVALTFSSTIIIVKLLSTKQELDTLHGRIALGFLIVQDIVVVIAMLTLSAIGLGSAAADEGPSIPTVLGAGAATLAGVLLFARFLAEPLTAKMAEAPELLIGFALALVALLAALGDRLGFGLELGGLLAGVALASTSYRDTISARMSPLRDFLLLFFFVSLGSQLEFENLGSSALSAAVLSAFVLIGNPLIVLIIMVVMGYTRRTGFLAGLTVAQISEFSLVFMAMGLSLGHVTQADVGLVTFVGIATIAISTYMITYSHQLYDRLEPMLRIFDRPSPREDASAQEEEEEPFDGIVFGLASFGRAVAHSLAGRGHKVLAVDIDPEQVAAWCEAGHDARFGDVSDPEFLEHLPVETSRWIVSTIHQHSAKGVNEADSRQVLVQALRDRGFEGLIAVTANSGEDAETLREMDVDIVFEPFEDAAERASDLIEAKAPPAEEPEAAEPAAT